MKVIVNNKNTYPEFGSTNFPRGTFFKDQNEGIFLVTGEWNDNIVEVYDFKRGQFHRYISGPTWGYTILDQDILTLTEN